MAFSRTAATVILSTGLNGVYLTRVYNSHSAWAGRVRVVHDHVDRLAALHVGAQRGVPEHLHGTVYMTNSGGKRASDNSQTGSWREEGFSWNAVPAGPHACYRDRCCRALDAQDNRFTVLWESSLREG